MERTFSDSFDDTLSEGDIVRAPGKLVLAGEYAVLDGAPALVLAIDRGVECLISKGTGIETPNGDLRFVAHATPFAKHHKLTFRDWNPVTTLPKNNKPGFGGSAAACVVATRIMDWPLQKALDIHQKIQGGGSGIDIRASIDGGLLQWSTDQQATLAIPPVRPVVIWTGQSAKTGPRVQTYLNYKNRGWFVQNSIRFTELFLHDPIRGTQALYNNLMMMSREANLPYLTPGIEEIVELAKRFQGAAKPSGAGGGDCMTGFFETEEAKARFIEAIDQHPVYQIIDYTVSEGLHVVKSTNSDTVSS